jgi:hypothetical protein
VVSVGYVNGVVRANYLGVFTTFMFDAGVLGLYVGAYVFHARRMAAARSTPWIGYFLFLLAWPTFMALLPINDVLVQLVALRATIWFLPVMLIASRLTAADLTVLARVLAVMNFFALAGGLYLYQNGVEALYPRNAVTEIIYMSKDVAGNEHRRVPSTLLSAHAYAGTMLYTLPFLLARLFGVRVGSGERALMAAAVAAALAGILLSATRAPVVMFVVATLVALVRTGVNVKVVVVALGLLAAGGYLASSNERLQRAASLGDTELVSARVQGSANEGFFDLVVAYPGGAGWGRRSGPVSRSSWPTGPRNRSAWRTSSRGS